MGKAEITGIFALKEYWSRALENQPDLNFKVLNIFSGADMIVITYVNHIEVKAAETLHFDENNMM